MKPSSLWDPIQNKVQTQKNIYKADYIASGLKMRVRRTPLKMNIIVRQHMPLNFTDGTFQTINIQVFNITL
jgi:hypothetical protein